MLLVQLRQSLFLTQYEGKHRPHQQIQQLSFLRVFSLLQVEGKLIQL